jgi:hypothetical protein
MSSREGNAVAYGDSLDWVFFEHTLEEVSGGSFDLVWHLEYTNLDFLQQ